MKFAQYTKENKRAEEDTESEPRVPDTNSGPGRVLEETVRDIDNSGCA